MRCVIEKTDNRVVTFRKMRYNRRNGKGGDGVNINFKQMEAFCALVEYKNFTRASQALFLSQSTISSHIHALEKETGLIWRERNYRKKVEITPEGEKVYQYASIKS